jgi:hypothetical protein
VNLTDPYHVQGLHYFRGNEFLLLAAIASGRCNANEFALEAQTAQIMAAVAAEAFIEELAFHLANLKVIGKAEHLCRVGTILQQLENSRVQVTDKLLIASQLLSGKPFDAGSQPYQSFRMLISLRNALVHPKVTTKPPGWFSFFVHNKLTVQQADAEHLLPDWSKQLQSKQCASWACRATSRIVLELIERLRQPTKAGDVPGIHEGLEKMWSWSRTDERIWSGNASDCI